MSNFIHKDSKRDIPKEFSEDTRNTIERMENNHSVIGVLYLQKKLLQFYTVPEIMAQCLASKLPTLNQAMYRAVTEIDIQNELVAYRIETNSFEITVAGNEDFTACVVHRLSKKKHKKRSHKSH